MASAHYREPAVVQFAQDAGISPASLALGHPIVRVWHDVQPPGWNLGLSPLDKQFAAALYPQRTCP